MLKPRELAQLARDLSCGRNSSSRSSSSSYSQPAAMLSAGGTFAVLTLGSAGNNEGKGDSGASGGGAGAKEECVATDEFTATSALVESL